MRSSSDAAVLNCQALVWLRNASSTHQHVVPLSRAPCVAQGEVMVANTMFSSQGESPRLTRLTLALLEDTGWYRINYTSAPPLTWGAGAGCDFVNLNCSAYMCVPGPLATRASARVFVCVNKGSGASDGAHCSQAVLCCGWQLAGGQRASLLLIRLSVETHDMCPLPAPSGLNILTTPISANRLLLAQPCLLVTPARRPSRARAAAWPAPSWMTAVAC